LVSLHHKFALISLVVFWIGTIFSAFSVRLVLRNLNKPKPTYNGWSFGVMGVSTVVGLLVFVWLIKQSPDTLAIDTYNAVTNLPSKLTNGSEKIRPQPPRVSISSGPVVFTGSDNESLSAATIEHRRRHVLTVTNPNPIPIVDFGMIVQLPESILNIKSLSQSGIVASPDWVPQELKVFGDSSDSLRIEPYATNELIGRWRVGFTTHLINVSRV
jgi:hypothetical protein